MYPRRQLELLAARKALLQAQIALRRMECLAAASKLAKPLSLVDRGLALWRRIAPFAKVLGVPAGMMLLQFLKRRRGGVAPVIARHKFGSIMALLPVIVRGVKMVQGLRAGRAAGAGR